MPLPPNTLPYQWRVTKYDPALRNETGQYLPDDWYLFSQIGDIFGGKKLTYQDYRRWETAYVNTALAFLSDADLDALRVVDRDNIQRYVNDGQCQDIKLVPDSLPLNSIVSRDDLPDVIRLALREVFWYKLETGSSISDLKFYLHFGWDFYMYIGSSLPSVKAIRYAESMGLFVEPKRSPCLETDE